MPTIEIYYNADILSRARSICGYLGSFDPPHKGHRWIMQTLLKGFEAVLMMVPARHFEKTVRFPQNAALDQRIEMLSMLTRQEKRMAVGLAYEVLFIRLAESLGEKFPQADIFFGMGNETFERLLDSKRYYERSGLVWNQKDQAALDELQRHIVIFGRSTNRERFIKVPSQLRKISSTRVRQTIKKLSSRSISHDEWLHQLKGMLTPEISEYLIQKRLYR